MKVDIPFQAFIIIYFIVLFLEKETLLSYILTSNLLRTFSFATDTASIARLVKEASAWYMLVSQP